MKPTNPTNAPVPTDPYKLAYLQAPNPGAKQYQVLNGYSQYVSDYKLYITTVETLKADAKIAALKAKVVKPIINLTQEKETAPKGTFVVLNKNTGATVNFSADMVNPVKYTATTPSDPWSISIDPAVVRKGVTPLEGHYLRRPSGNPPMDISLAYETPAEKTASVSVSYAVKAKGPAKTEPKKRSAAELKVLAEKKKEREERSRWFAEHKTSLAKAKIEEKLATSLVARASAIRKADPSVDTKADVENGWRVVTSPRKHRARRVTTTRKKGVLTKLSETVEV